MEQLSIALVYAIYFGGSITMTIWVANNLHKNGEIFLIDAFKDKQMGKSINQLLRVGFYLVNFGFILLFLKTTDKPENLVQSIEVVATKLGVVLIVLGGMHFFNIYNINKIRQKKNINKDISNAT